MPASHSSIDGSTSFTNACRCCTSEDPIFFVLGGLLFHLIQMKNTFFFLADKILSPERFFMVSITAFSEFSSLNAIPPSPTYTKRIYLVLLACLKYISDHLISWSASSPDDHPADHQPLPLPPQGQGYKDDLLSGLSSTLLSHLVKMIDIIDMFLVLTRIFLCYLEYSVHPVLCIPHSLLQCQMMHPPVEWFTHYWPCIPHLY